MSDETPKLPRRPGFRFGLRTMFVVLTATAVGGYSLALLVSSARHYNNDQEVRVNLRQIGLALMNYEVMQGCFPPQVLLLPGGKPYQGWRGIILPWTEKQPLPLDPKIAWNAPANAAVGKLRNRIYCGRFNPTNESRIVAVAGPGCFFDGMQQRTPKRLTRTPSKIIVLIDVEDSGIGWAEPKDWTAAEFVQRFNARTIGLNQGGFWALMADQSVQHIEYDRGLSEVLNMFRISDD